MERFTLEENGYNKNEVRAFVGEVTDYTEQLIKTLKIISSKNTNLEKELALYKLKEASNDKQNKSLNNQSPINEEIEIL